MEQLKIGKFISAKRKEQNLTQEKLAEMLGVSNKSVSKWETGKCMPDWSLHMRLCEILNISMNELLSGEAINEENLNHIADENALKLLKLLEKLNSQKNLFIGLFLVMVGRIPVFEAGNNAGDVQRFFAGLSVGLSVGITLIGLGWFAYALVQIGKTNKE
ncbi:helix-turn-helix domain-containing protein [Robinsoniella peoriensis]|uniref:helix-turn-helix domain-containing protein n=1 Tax=Robinsoniella peoriensis TaxID=180332 RepID=UPI003750AF84